MATSSYGTTTIKSAATSFSAPPSRLSAINSVSETHASEELRLKLVLESGDYDSAETLVLQTVSDFYGRLDIAESPTNMNKLDFHMSLVQTLVNQYIRVGEIPRLVTWLYRMQVRYYANTRVNNVTMFICWFLGFQLYNTVGF